MNNILKKIKKIGYKQSKRIGAVIILITAGVNLYGYFNLPDEIATQFSLTGGKANRMPTPLYLTLAFIIVLLISVLYIKSEKEQKIKLLVTDIVVCIANIAMIATQV